MATPTRQVSNNATSSNSEVARRPDKGEVRLPPVSNRANGAMGRLARILLDIAQNPDFSQEQKQDHTPNN